MRLEEMRCFESALKSHLFCFRLPRSVVFFGCKIIPCSSDHFTSDSFPVGD